MNEGLQVYRIQPSVSGGAARVYTLMVSNGGDTRLAVVLKVKAGPGCRLTISEILGGASRDTDFDHTPDPFFVGVTLEPGYTLEACCAVVGDPGESVPGAVVSVVTVSVA